MFLNEINQRIHRAPADKYKLECVPVLFRDAREILPPGSWPAARDYHSPSSCRFAKFCELRKVNSQLPALLKANTRKLRAPEIQN